MKFSRSATAWPQQDGLSADKTDAASLHPIDARRSIAANCPEAFWSKVDRGPRCEKTLDPLLICDPDPTATLHLENRQRFRRSATRTRLVQRQSLEGI